MWSIEYSCIAASYRVLPLVEDKQKPSDFQVVSCHVDFLKCLVLIYLPGVDIIYFFYIFIRFATYIWCSSRVGGYCDERVKDNKLQLRTRLTRTIDKSNGLIIFSSCTRGVIEGKIDQSR